MSTRPEVERARPSARTTAVTVLERVADRGAYASLTLDAELTRTKLPGRDAALATEIVYGTLRVLPELDRAISVHLKQELSRMDGFTRAALRAAAYQLAHLGRSPVHAIVDETVTLVRAKRGPRVGGFVNAVLRKLASARPADAKPPERLVVPEWFARMLEASLGTERMQAMLADHPLPPPTCLRVTLGRATRESVREQLQRMAAEAELEPSPLSAWSLNARRLGSARELPGYAQGEFSVQEEGAQLVALAVGAQPGERIADVCAGHGGKTTLLAQQVAPSGHVTAIDVDERKLERIPAELRRLGLAAELVDQQSIDVSVGTGGLPRSYDRVLVDAPCTGTGTVDRRPELLLRLQPSDPARMAQLQLRILSQAVKLVRPGGLLAYAVCSATRAEGVEVADALQAALPELERVHGLGADGLPPTDADGVLRIGPWLASQGSLCRPDVYQVLRFRVSR
jgi:16S rRNA (cytosine967-C5)-methyltransferase